MVNDISNTTQGGRALSTDFADRFRAGVALSRASTILPGGKPNLRLVKSGEWVYGQNDEDVQKGSEWAINPHSIAHGYVCWLTNPGGNAKNQLLGEVMCSVLDPKPPLPEHIAGGEWKEQRICEMKCLTGDDEGVEVVYKTPSLGGLRAFDSLLAAITAQIDAGNRDHIVAIVQLHQDFYVHNTYGRTYFPILNITGWADIDGNRLTKAGKPAAVAAPPADAKPAKKTKAPLAAVGQAAEQAAPDADDTLPQVDAAAVQPQRPGAPPRRQRPSARA
jgi:hypothetical protein